MKFEGLGSPRARVEDFSDSEEDYEKADLQNLKLRLKEVPSMDCHCIQGVQGHTPGLRWNPQDSLRRNWMSQSVLGPGA